MKKPLYKSNESVAGSLAGQRSKNPLQLMADEARAINNPFQLVAEEEELTQKKAVPMQFLTEEDDLLKAR